MFDKITYFLQRKLKQVKENKGDFTLIRNFLGMFPKTTAIVEFPKYEPCIQSIIENSGNFGKKIKWDLKTRLEISEKLSTPRDIDLFC